MLLYRLAQGDPWGAAVLTATAGNLLGSLATYGLGRVGNVALHGRWLRIGKDDIARAERWFSRWGNPALLLAWLPVVGDPLCLLAGLLRVGLPSFLLLVGLGKLTRYAFLAWAAA
jgi:membrane protein YqaA with SNARE-associated domain